MRPPVHRRRPAVRDDAAAPAARRASRPCHPPVADSAGGGERARRPLATALQALDTWPDLRIGLDELAGLLATVQPCGSTTAGLRAIYGTYAERHGKPRWGDKTPVHVRYMSELAGVFPEARFVHLIRDGRDVTVPLRQLPFAPGDGSPEAIAALWRDQIAAARRQAETLPHFPRGAVRGPRRRPGHGARGLCEWLGLEDSPAMLTAHERAAERFAELPEVRDGVTGPAVREQRMAIHAHTLHPRTRPGPAAGGRCSVTTTSVASRRSAARRSSSSATHSPTRERAGAVRRRGRRDRRPSIGESVLLPAAVIVAAPGRMGDGAILGQAAHARAALGRRRGGRRRPRRGTARVDRNRRDPLRRGAHWRGLDRRRPRQHPRARGAQANGRCSATAARSEPAP